MAFRTNKMPVLQEKSASGSVATFNTALAMPLVECKTEFMCTQASGTPSPSNPLAITGVDDITITANGNSVVIDLDGTRYGGYVDVVNNLIHITDEYANSIGITPKAYFYYSNGSVQFQYMMQHSSLRAQYICNMSKFITSETSDIWCGVNNTTVYWIGILNSLSMTLDDFITWISNNPLEVVYKLREADQFDISLSDIPTLSTIIGNNSFASDSGSIELTYKDLDIAKRGNFREVFKLPS